MDRLFSRADLPARIRRLTELASKMYFEATRVVQQSVPLKADEIKAYAAALMGAAGNLDEARQVLEKALRRGQS